MANRIIVTDGDWSADTIRFVPRTTLPQVVSGLAAGQYYLANTGTAPQPITVTAASQPGTTFTVTPDATFSVAPDPANPGTYVFDITAPAHGVGTKTVTTAQLAAGPVAIIAPYTTGVIAVEEILTTIGAYGVSSAGQITATYQMRRNGANINAANPLAYQVVPADLGTTLQVVALLTDANGTSGDVLGNTIVVPADALRKDTFLGFAAATHLLDQTTQSGETWTKPNGNTSKHLQIETNGRVYPQGGESKAHYLRGASDRGVKQFAEADIGQKPGQVRKGASPLVRGTAVNGIYLAHPTTVDGSTEQFQVRQKVGGALTTLFSFPRPDLWGTDDKITCRVRLEVDGATVRAYLNGSFVGTGTTTLTTGGGCGLSTGELPQVPGDSGYATNFHCGSTI